MTIRKEVWHFKTRATNRHPKGKSYRIERFSLSDSPTPNELSTHERIVSLFKSCFSDEPWKMRPEDAETQGRQQLQTVYGHEQGVCLVVRHKGKVVGFALGLPLSAFRTPEGQPLSPEQIRQTKECYMLSHVGIDTTHRHVGLSRQLSRIRQKIAKSRGFIRALVALHPEAAPRFVNAYVNDGFSRIESRTFKRTPDEPPQPNLYEKAIQTGRSHRWKDPEGSWYSKPAPHSW